MFGLREINLYPYLNYLFYFFFFCFLIRYRRDIKKLFYLFVITLVFESAFIIDVGFFVKANHIAAIMLIVMAARFGFVCPIQYRLVLCGFFVVAITSILINIDLVGAATLESPRANFLRPVIQLMQFSVLALTMCSMVTIFVKCDNFKETMCCVHWLSVIVALYAIYEVAACFLHLPFLNLNNDLSSYWYLGIASHFPMFRPRSTFYEPINLNSFQFFGIACSLIYRELYKKEGIKYWGLFLVQFAVLILSFSRSTLLIVPVVAVMFWVLYPRKPEEDWRLFTFKKGLKLAVIFLCIGGVALLFFKGFPGLGREHAVNKIFFGRFLSMNQDVSIAGRAGALQEIKELSHDGKIVLGIGMGNEFNWRTSGTSVASFYNQILVYTGAIGLCLFILFLVLIFCGLFRNIFDTTNTFMHKKINLIYLSGLLAMMVQRLVFAGFLTDTYLWAALACGIYVERTFRRSYCMSIETISSRMIHGVA